MIFKCTVLPETIAEAEDAADEPGTVYYLDAPDGDIAAVLAMAMDGALGACGDPTDVQDWDSLIQLSKTYVAVEIANQ